MIKAVIVDDEPHCIQRLERLLKTHFRESVHLSGAFETVTEGIHGIESLQPELVFLDVQINDQTGFDLLRQVKEVNFEIIFTTAYEKYALQAFKFSAVDYLLKPVDLDDLSQSIEKLSKRALHREITGRLETLFHNLKKAPGAPPKISIPTLDGLIFLNAGDIIRCQSHVNYTVVHLQDKQKITVARTLKEFEELLKEHNFFRVHNSHLINLGYIRKYHKGKGGFISMADDSVVEVSSRRKAEFLKRLSVSG